MKSFLLDFKSNVIELGKRQSHTNTYGYTRGLFALSTLLTLIFNDSNILFPESTEISFGSLNQSFLKEINLFWLLQNELLLAKSIAILILTLVIIGIYPRFTVIPHWWVSSSFLLSSQAIEGGDQLIAIITLLFIPIGLTDKRKWHWVQSNEFDLKFKNRRFFINSFYIVIRIQIFILYLQAFIGKLSVDEWLNGTVLYYWFEDNIFGLNEIFRNLIFPLLENYFILSLLTYSVLILELILALALVMETKKRKPILSLGIVFHFLIWLVHGLPTFFITMSGALIIYILPFYKNLSLKKLKITRCISNSGLSDKTKDKV